MAILEDILARAKSQPRAISADELASLLALGAPDEIALMRAAAYEVKLQCVGKNVSMRGIIEAGNVCAKDCFYCGIRKGNAKVERFQLSRDEILRAAEENLRQQYGSLVIQSGEIESEAHTEFVEDALREIMKMSGGSLGVTLSLGEQSRETYRRWRVAGASRYLLRIETSSPELYARLHPADAGHSYARRRERLRLLRETGYQVGSGVMCGLPGQSLKDLARDIVFFADEDLDMIGMGPYIPHRDTPLGAGAEFAPDFAARQLRLGLNMISATRLFLHDVNIASTTALQALAGDGREQGLLAGANVIMPNITETAYRRRYQLYDNKPCLDENSEQCRSCLARRIEKIGESINWNRRGDSPHFHKRAAARAPQP